MNRREEIRQAYNDACYDAWREGRNPDMVDRDTFDDLAWNRGADQVSWRDCYPNHGRPAEPQEEEPDYEE